MRGIALIVIVLGVAGAAQAEPARTTEARVDAAEARLRISDNTARAQAARERARRAARACAARGGTWEPRGSCAESKTVPPRRP